MATMTRDELVAHMERIAMGRRKRQKERRKGESASCFARISRQVDGARRRALRRGFECTLTADEAMAQFDKQNGRCYYTGILMTVGGGDGSRLERASLDRIDPKKGNNILDTP